MSQSFGVYEWQPSRFGGQCCDCAERYESGGWWRRPRQAENSRHRHPSAVYKLCGPCYRWRWLLHIPRHEAFVRFDWDTREWRCGRCRSALSLHPALSYLTPAHLDRQGFDAHPKRGTECPCHPA